MSTWHNRCISWVFQANYTKPIICIARWGCWDCSCCSWGCWNGGGDRLCRCCRRRGGQGGGSVEVCGWSRWYGKLLDISSRRSKQRGIFFGRCQTPAPQQWALKQLAQLVTFVATGEPQGQVEVRHVVLDVRNAHGILPIGVCQKLPQPSTFLSIHRQLHAIAGDGPHRRGLWLHVSRGLGFVECQLQGGWNHQKRLAVLTSECLNEVRNGTGLATAWTSMVHGCCR